VIKRQFGDVEIFLNDLMKKTTQLLTQLALSNLRLTRNQLMGVGRLHPQHGKLG
jgi:hypothetical protein